MLNTECVMKIYLFSKTNAYLKVQKIIRALKISVLDPQICNKETQFESNTELKIIH